MAAPDLINGLGGPAGFGSNLLAAGDDNSSSAISLSSVFPNGLNFFGTTYTSIFINNNGNLTFGSASSTFTPSQITGNTSIPIIAAYFADVDTRGGAGASTGGNATGSNRVYWNLDTVGHIFTVTWDDVGYYSSHTNKLDAFQIQLIDESTTGAGNFDIEFRYEAVNWTTGDASGGSNGLGGTVARAGFSAGDGINFFELPQSGNQSQMLGLPTTAAPAGTLGAQPETGVYIFQVRNGVVQQSTLFDFVFTYNDGKDYYYGTVADNGTFGYHTGQVITTVSGEYNIFGDEGSTTQASGTVAVTYYSHGGPGQASYIPAMGGADGTIGLGSEADSILGTDGLQHTFGPTEEASFSTSTLYGFVFTYSGGAAYYSGTVADDGTYGYAAIAASASPYLTVSDGIYYIFSEGSTAEASGTVIVNYYRDGSTATTFPIDHFANGVSEGDAGLGSEIGYFFSSDGGFFKFTNTEEAVDPPLPSGVAVFWAFDGANLVGGAIGGDSGPTWRLDGVSFPGGTNVDMLWRNDSGEVATWQASATTLFDNAAFGNPGPDWYVAGTGDYDGNGTSDVLWQNGDGRLTAWMMNGATSTLRTVIDPNPGTTWHLQAG